MRCGYRTLAITVVGFLFFVTCIHAQSPTPPAQQDQSAPASQLPQTTPDSSANVPSAPLPQQSQTGTPAEDGQKGKDTQYKNGTSNDRLGFVLPNFLTLENAGQVPPLTSGQKFKAVARGAFDYVQYPWYGFLAGISQAENSESAYGQGAQGYAKRYGAAFADGTIENFMVGAVFPSLLHQDPRFFQSEDGSVLHRADYAVSRIVITRGDSGKREFNCSEICGSALAAVISTYSYHPREDRTLGNTASVWGSEIGWDTLTLVVKEFWPDIRRKIRKPKQ